MSAQPTSRNLRPRNEYARLPDCDRCGGRLDRELRADDGMPQDRCAACFHACTHEAVVCFDILNQDTIFRPLCLCPCECTDANFSEDEDFEIDDMELDEDDLTTQLDERTERTFTARYGFFTNVVLNQNTEGERRLFIEGPGHYAVASSHDIGRPAESSTLNTENRVGRIEATSLRNPIEPWEAEAVHMSTGRTYNELRRIFPELRSMQLPAPPRVEQVPAPNLVCPSCNKSVTDEFMQWLRSGRVTFCLACGSARRPRDPEEDPDWHEHRVGNFASVAEALEHCRCRCGCDGPGFHQAEAEAQLVTTPITRDDDTESETDYAPPPLRRISRDAVERPRLPHIDSIVLPPEGEITDDELLEVFQVRLREMFGLPVELQFHLQHLNGPQVVLAIMEQLHQYGEIAMRARAWDEAYRCLQAAGQVGRYHADLPYTDDAIVEIYRDLRDVYEHLLDRANTTQDTIDLEDIDTVLDRHGARN